MSIQLVYLPPKPELPDDMRGYYRYGTPEYDKAAQDFARDMRHYRNSLRSYTKRCIKQLEERNNSDKI